MWPFNSKTLYDRYSKLIKLIMSIDSHFEVTENNEDSVHLHLPNYKGNQPIDFHIYLMEPFLFIAFTTEIEGEKISTTNSYPQDMDQQDIFNAAMASNLERIHQCLAEKNKNDEENDEIIVKKKDTSSKDSKGENVTYGIVKTWPLLDFARAHGRMQLGEFSNKETGEVFKSCIFTKPDGTRTFVAFAAKMGELTPKQIAEMKNELQVVQLESGNYSLCKRATSGWEEVDLKESEPYSIGTVVKTKDFIRGRGIKVLSPKGCFGIMDVRIDESSWKVKRSYHNIIEGQGYVIGDIQTIEYDKEKDILKVIFNYVLKEGYDAIWFNRQYSKICVTFYKQGEFIRCFDSEYDKAYTSLENLFAAFCALSRLDGDNAIVTLSGEAFQTDYILNYYDEKLIHDFIPLAEEDFVFSMLKKDDTDDYYLKQYSMTKKEYFSKNYNKVSYLTAKCRRNVSNFYRREEYPELEVGKTYDVSHIGVLRSSSWIILREFGDKEYNAACFEIFENGESIEKWYTNDRRFWAPYLRERFHS